MAKSIRTIISKLGSACSSSMERRRSVKMPMRYADSASGAERVEAIANSQHSTDPILRFHTIIIQILHQTTTERILYKNFVQLYLIKNLHQTTTTTASMRGATTLYLIKNLHQTTTRLAGNHGRVWLYLIKNLHQTTTSNFRTRASQSCILSKIYIKPQLDASRPYIDVCCILSKIYIKPQQRSPPCLCVSCCILSKIYIKPQPGVDPARVGLVVSYQKSTSNHNFSDGYVSAKGLYLIKNLHQTTTHREPRETNRSCILSKIYIKPQRPATNQLIYCVIYQYHPH